MSKTKRLLSVTLAIAMIILSAFSAFAEDTETVVETVGAMSVAADSIETDDTTFDVNVKISFNEVVTGPHNIITLTCDKFNLTNVELGDVAYTYTGSEEVPDIGTVQLPQGKVTIAEDGVKNVNWATGKVLIEAPVDVNAPLVSEINLTATFTLKDDVALVAGETLNIAVANDDMADASETKLSISSGASVVTVHGAGTTYGYDETNHWHACVVEGCTEHTYDVAAHTMSDYVLNEDGTAKTATCTDNCGYSHTKDVEVVVPTEPVAGTIDLLWNEGWLADYGNKITLSEYKYEVAYAFNDLDYFSTVNAAADKKLELVITGDGLNFTKVVADASSSWYDANTAYFAQCSLARLNSDLTWKLILTYTDTNGIEHVDTSNSCTTNFIERLNELKDTYTGDEAARIVAFLNFNTAWKNADEYKNIGLTTHDYKNNGEVEWNLNWFTDEYIFFNFSDFKTQMTYSLPNDLFATLKSARDAGTLKFSMSITGATTNFTKELPITEIYQDNTIYFAQVSPAKMMEDLTWKLTYEINGTVTDTASITVNISDELSGSTDPVAQAFLAYAALCQ